MKPSFFRRRIVSVVSITILALTQWAAVAVTAQAVRSTANSAFTVEDMLDMANVTVADLSRDGRWLAATMTSLRDRLGINNYRFGDPTYIAPSVADVWIIDTQTAKSQKLFPEKRQVRALKWSPDGNRLALLVLKGELFEPTVWERATGKLGAVKLPQGKYVAENSEIEWSADSRQVILSLRAIEWREKTRERFEYETKGPIVVHAGKEPFLAWEDLRRSSLVRSLVTYDIDSGQLREVVPETKLNSYDIAQDGSFVRYLEDFTKKTDYDIIGGSDNQVQILPLAGGQPRTVIKSTRGLTITWSRDGRCYAYSKDGNVFFGTIDDKEPRQLTGKKPDEKPTPSAEKGTDDTTKDKKETERFTSVRLSPNGDSLVVSNKEGLWVMDTTSASRDLIVKIPEDDKQAPRYEVIDWSPDGANVYLSFASRTKWERGVCRYDRRAKRLDDLFKDSRLFSGFRLAHNGATFVFSSADGNRPADIYTADAEFKSIRRLTDVNPLLKEKRLSKTELVSYLDVDGNRSYGVLYYPVDYEVGKKYPTVFNIYEQFFDDTFNGTINILTSNGYAVMQPSVTFETGFPGEAWVKAVTAAANKLIEMGVADPDRLGVQGTSYGGYATNLLITQTNRFKAAINISGKVNMISFYTDSPRLGVRNIHAPEKSQDRIGATLWQQPQKYIQHSAIMFADRIKTPLLLMTGEQDHNVPARQAMEMYYALRRLNKEVEWVSYVNGGHGMPTTTVEEVKDYHSRIIGWYDRHLKGDLKKKGEAVDQ
jgi:dipeptidyl aminopeptidase/acylaminoacyl peptidase